MALYLLVGQKWNIFILSYVYCVCTDSIFFFSLMFCGEFYMKCTLAYHLYKVLLLQFVNIVFIQMKMTQHSNFWFILYIRIVKYIAYSSIRQFLLLQMTSFSCLYMWFCEGFLIRVQFTCYTIIANTLYFLCLCMQLCVILQVIVGYELDYI